MRVTTMDAELEFAIQPSTTGKQLFDQVHSDSIALLFYIGIMHDLTITELLYCYSVLGGENYWS